MSGLDSGFVSTIFYAYAGGKGNILPFGVMYSLGAVLGTSGLQVGESLPEWRQMWLASGFLYTILLLQHAITYTPAQGELIGVNALSVFSAQLTPTHLLSTIE